MVGMDAAAAGAARTPALDPNVRLGPTPYIAHWRERVGTFAGCAHLIKVSEEDLHLLYPERDLRQVAATGAWANYPKPPVVAQLAGGDTWRVTRTAQRQSF